MVERPTFTQAYCINLGEPAAADGVREAVGDALTVTDARPLGVCLLDGL